jgi:hypothetical protein
MAHLLRSAYQNNIKEDLENVMTTAEGEIYLVDEDVVRTWIGPEKRSQSDNDSVYQQLSRIQKVRNRHAHLTPMGRREYDRIYEIVMNENPCEQSLLHRILVMKIRLERWLKENEAASVRTTSALDQGPS